MIRWPDRYKPEATAVHARTELEMPVPPEAVWAWLVRAERWPTWCPDFAEVVIEGGGPDLRLGSRFRWRAFGVALTSRVEEFVEPERIAWSARSTGIDAYHAWLIERRHSGCRVLTEENQNGLVARLNNALRPKFMPTMQKAWLERLAEKAKGGQP
jgi:uncharacterized protein YndB with AHSA1/START domain